MVPEVESGKPVEEQNQVEQMEERRKVTGYDEVSFFKLGFLWFLGGFFSFFVHISKSVFILDALETSASESTTREEAGEEKNEAQGQQH